ncbi:MAG: Hsp33 family molecular chaperone HslO [Erythrobacter sp.]|nr:Hsp33 family molecular chaperone HslO [Erythrobacter sp.]NCQ64220.1 Hsp33 family molecular chaperone HslO [Alphaproteobacteria bacterium]
MNDQSQNSETFADQLLGASIPARDTRLRLVRLDETLAEILAAHDYPPAIRNLLAEALVIGALIGGLIDEDEGQMTMQAQTRAGVVNLLVCDFRAGAIRGYVDFDKEKLAELGANPSLKALFGEGYLAITFDVPERGGRYQGIVPLEGESLAEACESYFMQSEQVPTMVRVAVSTSGNRTLAAGLLAQHLPDGEVGRERLHVRLSHPHWQHIEVMASSIRHEELLDEGISLEGLVWRLFHEEDEVRVFPGARLSRGCRCSVEHYQSVIGRFPAEERDEMRDENGDILVDCAFCSKVFTIVT